MLWLTRSHRYDAAIISIFRSGEPVAGKLGEVEFRIGDTLLMVGKPKGIEGSHNDFVLVSQIGNQRIINHPVQMVIAPLFFAAMVGVVAASLTGEFTSMVWKDGETDWRLYSQIS